MNTVKILVTILVTAIVGSLVWALFLPSEVHISKSISIEAPIKKAFDQVNNFHNWHNWAPYQDSSYNARFDGNKEGVGAKMLWSDEKEGESVNTIIESIPNKKVVTELAFNEQNKAQNIFLFSEFDGKTEVTWKMDVNNLSYPFGRFVGYMIRKGAEYNFTLGLEALKTYVENNKNKPDYSGYTISEKTVDAMAYYAKTSSSTMDVMKNKIDASFELILTEMGKNNIAPIGYPIIEWITYNPESSSDFRCLMGINKNVELNKVNSDFLYQLPSRRVIWLKHYGSYEKYAMAWEALNQYVKNNNLLINGNPYEEYIIDPSNEPDTSKWITNIYFPIKDKE
jgi:effector-binding domain-containing protein